MNGQVPPDIQLISTYPVYHGSNWSLHGPYGVLHATLEEIVQVVVLLEPRVVPEPVRRIVEQLGVGENQAPRVGSFCEDTLKQDSSDSLGNAARLGSLPEEIQDVEAEPDCVRVGVSQLVDDRVEEVILT